MFLNENKSKAFLSNGNPDFFVKYGKYEMHIRDKILIEKGYVTHAKVKWYGMGNFAYPHLWKEKPTDTEYKEAWGDPRISETKKIEKEQNISKNIKKNREMKR